MTKRLRNRFSILCLTLAAAPGIVLAGDVYSKVATSPQGHQVILSNGLLQMTFAPERGGRCVQFEFLDNPEQVIDSNNPYSGMFIDHWARFAWPSGLMFLPYQYEIVGDGQDSVGIRLWVTVPATGGGKGNPTKETSLKIQTAGNLVGLVVQKTIMLKADSDVVHVEMILKNPFSESRSAALYIQNAFNMAGSLYNDVWYMPYPRGVAARIMPNGKGGQGATGPEQIENPTAGWMAVKDTVSRHGLVFAFDYNYLRSLYTCGSTAEWRMENVPLLPHGQFKTDYVIKPVRHFEEFDHASKHIVADIIADETDKGVRVFHDLIATDADHKDVDVSVSVLNWKTKEVEEAFNAHIDVLTSDKKERQEFSFKPSNLADGLVIKVQVSNSQFSEYYQCYYVGDKEEYERRHHYFAGDAALPTAVGTSYYFEPPGKRKSFAKPDLSKLAARPRDSRYRVLVVFGLYTEHLNLDDALVSWEPPRGKSLEFTWANCPPGGVEHFPASYENLFSYDVIVLSNVNRESLGDIRIEQLCDYLEHGGNVLVSGGFYTYGNGEFEDSRFLKVLPVMLSGPFDLKWAGKNKSWPLRARQGSRMAEGLPMDASPKVYWCHFFTARPDADVVLTAAGQPMLTLGQYGRGKIAALALTPMGNPDEGDTPWWRWGGWPMVAQRVFGWFGEGAFAAGN